MDIFRDFFVSVLSGLFADLLRFVIPTVIRKLSQRKKGK